MWLAWILPQVESAESASEKSAGFARTQVFRWNQAEIWLGKIKDVRLRLPAIPPKTFERPADSGELFLCPYSKSDRQVKFSAWVSMDPVIKF